MYSLRLKIVQRLKSLKSFNKRRNQVLIVIAFLFILFIGFQNCQTNKGEGGSASAVSVTNLTYNPAPKSWSWGCNKEACEYRHHFSTSGEAYKFDTEPYNSKNTASPPDESKTYYIHVQARDTITRKESQVISKSAASNTDNALKVTGLQSNTTPVSSVTWQWNCSDPPCQFRHAVSSLETVPSEFLSEVTNPYNDETTSEKSGVHGIYYLHVQAKKGSQESEVTTVSVVIEEGSDSALKSQISTGGYYSCYLHKTGLVKCWGSNKFGQLGLNEGHGVDDNDSKRRIGDEPNEMKNLPVIELGEKVKAIATAGRGKWENCPSIQDATEKAECESRMLEAQDAGHTCAILDNGQVKCWGKNRNGQLGIGDNAIPKKSVGNQAGEMASLGTVDLGGTHTAKAIALGGQHTCAILDNDCIKCWGGNTKGQLGYGSAGADNLGDEPNEMGGNLGPVGGENFKVKAIAAGFQHTCTILNDDTIKCWGANGSGQLGLDDNTDRDDVKTLNTSVNLGGKAKAIAAGGYHTCAILENSKVKCWGLNNHGQLGQGTRTTYNPDKSIATNENIGDEEGEMASLQYVDLGGNRTAKAIVAGVYHTCTLLDNGKMKCWGDNTHGPLGIGDNTGRKYLIGDESGEMGDQLQVVPAGVGRKVASISAGGWNSCFILDNGHVKCWGHNWLGQLGQGYRTRRDDNGTPNDESDDFNVGDIGDDEAITSIDPIPLPFNGKCGIQRNTCLVGEPDDEAIADTNAHYTWHCKGANGGTTAQDCTAAISAQ